MIAYLVQHGEAKPKEEDPERPLTRQGRDDVARVARDLVPRSLELGRILHSGKRRAAETAEILATHLEPREGVEEAEGLGPLDDPAEARRLLEEADRPLMLVGHLPHLSRLASSLLTGDQEREVVSFRNGGVLCLESGEQGWEVSWYLTPELAGV